MNELSRIKRRKGGFKVEKEKGNVVISRRRFAEDDKEMYQSV